MPEIASKRRIMRACKSQGWMVQAAALSLMHEHLNQMDKDYLGDVIFEMSQHIDSMTTLITEDIWNGFMNSNHGVTSNNKVQEEVEIVNAFDCPRLSYDTMRKAFSVEEKQWPLLGSVTDKINVMAQRFSLMQQRVLRHNKFRKKGNSNGAVQTLTPIESLLGKQNSSLVSVLVLGILTQVEEGKYYLEDHTGQVEVSFTDAKAAEAFYITENSILLVEATFQDEILYAHRVWPPLVEQREKSLQMLQQQVNHSHFLPTPLETGEGSFVLLSDVHLDQPRVLDLLEGLFKNYEPIDDQPTDLPVFCFMGNFASTSNASIQQGFEDLAMLLSNFSTLASQARFVFIPGPNDSNCSILPQAPLVQEMPSLQKTMESYQIDNVHWGSNPCRIRRNGKEMVLFRYDVLAWILQNQVRLPQEDGAVDRSPHSRMVRTVLDQAHLLPVARAPIYWNYDHALRLYPLPDALVIGGSTAKEDYEIFDKCHSIQPASFSKNGEYAVYSLNQLDPDEMGDEDVLERSNVIFCKVTAEN